MALVLVTPPKYFGPLFLRDAAATTVLIDAFDEYTSWIIQAPRDGTIDRIHFVATTVTANGSGLRGRIETLSTTTAFPSGTLWAGSAEVTITTVTANSWNRSPAGLNAAVSRGDYIAVKLKSPASGTTFNGTIRNGYSGLFGPGMNLGTGGLLPYVVSAIPTATTAVPNGMAFALEYTDGVTPWIEGAIPISSAVVTAFGSGSSPNERGNLFQVRVPMRVVGVYNGALPSGANQAVDFFVYDAADGILGQVSWDMDNIRQIAGGQSSVHLFPDPFNLAKDTNYRLTQKPTVAGTSSQVHYVVDTTTGGTRLREALIDGTSWQLTTRTGAGAWTDTPDSIACIGLIADMLDDGAGAAGGGLRLVGHGGLAA